MREYVTEDWYVFVEGWGYFDQTVSAAKEAELKYWKLQSGN